MSADRTNKYRGETTMKHLLRPYHNLSFVNLGMAALCAVTLAAAPRAASAQAQELAPIFEEPSPLAIHPSAAGYLGVQVDDIDNDKAQALKLKDVHGAVITLIDHDAPAGQIGLKVNDVVLAVNGQSVEGAEALRRMLREIPPGRKISLEVSRDGNIQTLAVQLADRKTLDHDIWGKIGVEAGPITPAPPAGMGIFAGGDATPATGFHMSLFTSTLNVGALVEPLTSQMADYLGVPAGLMVKQVARKGEAAASGLKAFDVILKVGSDSIATAADWDRALRSNQGKPVQVTILRDRKQQTLTLQVDSKHRSALDYDDLFASDSDVDVAGLSPLFDDDIANEISAQAAAAADAEQREAQEFADQFQSQIDSRMFSAEEAEKMRHQAEKLGQSMKDFQVDPDQIKALQQNAEKPRQSMKDFQVDPKQMEQLRRQMQEFQKNFNSDQMKQLQHQTDQFRQQMEQWQHDNCVPCV
jgi:membrane-associated protease RseP (regulator of RpoE activity)